MSNKRTIIFISLLIGTIIILYAIFSAGDKEDAVNITKQEVDLNVRNIKYSQHARCRMECRYIDEEEVLDVITNGKINRTKTRHNKKGITYAYEGTTRDRQRVRIIVAPEQNLTTIVTVIDLDNEYKCECS